MGSTIRFRFKIAISACYHNSRNTLECWWKTLKRSVEGGGGERWSSRAETGRIWEKYQMLLQSRGSFFATDSAEKNTYILFSVLQFQFLAGIFFIHQHEVIRVRIVRHRRSSVGCIVDNVAAVIV